ncbi:MAG TPA: glucose-6-phosphate isomerase [Candidatus Omnitrophica bacterium]|nr:glucose-6-phosphate isomerase [Candidatus Omnitrophota bacterium]
MINLKINSGLALKLNLKNLELIFGNDIASRKALVRNASEMKDVLLGKNEQMQEGIYYMYRGLSRINDCDKIQRNSLRYDVTVIASGFLGEEFVKTFGHYHSNSYPEVYEILWGEALCILQKSAVEDPLKIEDVILIRAKAKEKIVIPPGYGHILINPSVNLPLVSANWISVKLESDYSIYKKAKGAAYFVTNNDGEFDFIKNNSYKNLPDIRVMHSIPSIEEFGISFDKPIYNILETAEKLDFLNNPGKYNFDNCFLADKRAFSAIPL